MAAKKPSAQARSPKIAIPTPTKRPAVRSKVKGSVKKTTSLPEEPEAMLPHLMSTHTPGIYTNVYGSYVDSRGVLASLAEGKLTEAEMAQALIGGPIDSPAKLLKFIALDVTRPMIVRLDAAKAAAPYFDKKTPVSIEQKNEDFTLDALAIAALPVGERRKLLDMLKSLGVDLANGAKKGT